MTLVKLLEKLQKDENMETKCLLAKSSVKWVAEREKAHIKTFTRFLDGCGIPESTLKKLLETADEAVEKKGDMARGVVDTDEMGGGHMDTEEDSLDQRPFFGNFMT